MKSLQMLSRREEQQALSALETEKRQRGRPRKTAELFCRSVIGIDMITSVVHLQNDTSELILWSETYTQENPLSLKQIHRRPLNGQVRNEHAAMDVGCL